MYKLSVNTETFGFFRTFLPYFFGRKGAFFVILHNFSENVRLYASSPYSAEKGFKRHTFQYSKPVP